MHQQVVHYNFPGHSCSFKGPQRLITHVTRIEGANLLLERPEATKALLLCAHPLLCQPRDSLDDTNMC